MRRRARRPAPGRSLLRRAWPPTAPRDQRDCARQDGRERDQVETVVLQHRFERTRIAVANELEKARGNFDSRARRQRDAVRQMCFSSTDSEQLESSGSGVPMVSGRCRHSRRAGVQHVEMRHVRRADTARDET